jgi:hypothetical protein
MRALLILDPIRGSAAVRRKTTIGGDLMKLENATRRSRRAALTAAMAAGLALLACSVGSAAASSAGCSFCGKNLVKNPGAESGKGQSAENETGAVPDWTKTTGAFGAASYTASGFWFSPTAKGPKDRGKNYFFGGGEGGASSTESVGTQTIKLPAGAVGHKAVLSGWLGNYSNDTVQVRAQFMNSSGKMLSAIRIGPDTTIGGGDMDFRTRNASVPAGTASISVVVTFTDHVNANLAGADDISLVLN